MGHTNI